MKTIITSTAVKKLAHFCVLMSLSIASVAAVNGINFPPTQGTTNSGAFLPGVMNYSYTTTQIKNSNSTFDSMRLPINVETANNAAALAKLKSYVDQFPSKHAIICMFDTLVGLQTGHGDGKPNNLNEMGDAWAKVHAVFKHYDNVRYEIFNEPFGYDKNNPKAYVSDMKKIIARARLPRAKVILDGMGYASDVEAVVAGGWIGDLAYHFYPNWSPVHTQEAYSNLVQTSLANVSNKTWITEFGANLTFDVSDGYANSCYNTYVDGNQPYSASVNALRGLDDALRALKAKGKGVKGTFHWNGWHNNDTYDFWATASAQGACKVKTIQAND